MSDSENLRVIRSRMGWAVYLLFLIWIAVQTGSCTNALAN